MKFTNFIFPTLLLSSVTAFSSFNISCKNNSHSLNHRRIFFLKNNLRLLDSASNIPENLKVSNLVSNLVSGNVLRTSIVMNASGDYLALDSVMGKGTSVVVFLRHMG